MVLIFAEMCKFHVAAQETDEMNYAIVEQVMGLLKSAGRLDKMH